MTGKGYLALVLHAHLPYVRHPEADYGQYLEERWLYEAITESYSPLLRMFERLEADEVPFRLTLSITPTLLSMLSDRLCQERYWTHLQRSLRLAEREIARTEDQPEFQPLAKHYHRELLETKRLLQQWNGNLVNAYRHYQEMGFLDIVTSSATHAFLPLLATEESVRAQIQTGVAVYEQHFGHKPSGIWLPECAYVPGLDRALSAAGLKYFVADTHALTSARPTPAFGTLSPVLTRSRVAVFARDAESSRQVWSSHEGYPGDVDYREYYRDIGYDLDIDLIREFIHPDGIRVNTGFKYYRTSGGGIDKQPYQLSRAADKARQHAEHFHASRSQHVDYWAEKMGRAPIVVAPFDAELFGHWWYEGPQWLEALLRLLASEESLLKAGTPLQYLQQYEDYQVCDIPFSSWGRDGYADVWLNGKNDWVYPVLHECEREMVELASRCEHPDAWTERALRQAARELMLAQSSDWAFIMDNETMVDYAIKRVKQHVQRFRRLSQMLREGAVEPQVVGALEALDHVFPTVDYRLYQNKARMNEIFRSDNDRAEVSRKPSVLMLSWEFPPMTVGGLSRHVFDLARYLVTSGWDVHVLTTEIGDYPKEEDVLGIYVHRVHVRQPDGGEFFHWTLQLNLMMVDEYENLLNRGFSFAVVHAHDWLVAYAAEILKDRHGLPLVATIHATEHGRNHGIRTELQQRIHALEWGLTYRATRVILCSTYMQREAVEIFSLPRDKTVVIPNGVDPAVILNSAASPDRRQAVALDGEQIVLYLGRLVREKGVHVLVEAAPRVLAECPQAKFVLIGAGPERPGLEARVREMGLADKVVFLGFVSDEERNAMLCAATVAVFPSLYEPFGIVALEAMAAGAAVVASDVGGLGDVVRHEQTGLTSLVGDSASVAAQIVRILQNPEWAEQLTQSAQQALNQYDWRHIAEATIHVYQQVMHPVPAVGVVHREDREE